MTDAEIILNHDIADLKSKQRAMLNWNAQLLRDAIDAIEIGEQAIAIRRIKSVLDNFKG